MAIAICVAFLIGLVEYFLILGLFGVPIAALCLLLFVALGVLVWIKSGKKETV